MRWAGKASAAKDPHLHSKVFSILLGHDIARRFRRAEQRVETPIDAALLRNAVVILRLWILPSRGKLYERHLIGSVAVDLIRAHVNEYGVARIPPRRFEQIERADGIDVEVVKRYV